MNKIYAYATFDDGRRIESAFVVDQVGVRMFVAGDGKGVELLDEWRGARLLERKVRNDRNGIVFSLEFERVDDPLPFTLEHWGGCHCHHVLKRFRIPAWSTA